jgi:hypothetical protein
MTSDVKSKPLTVEQKSAICVVIELGCDRETAANRVGCTLADIRRAIKEDAKFSTELRWSEASAEMKHMRVVYEATKDVKNWRASVWWLERHAPERFGPRGAGAITIRQMKAYTALVAETVCDSTMPAEVRQQVLSKLSVLSNWATQFVRDEAATDDIVNSLTSEPWNETDGSDPRDSESSVADLGFDFDRSF